MLGVGTNIIRGLTNEGLLPVSNGFRNGFARLIPAEEVQQFAQRYVATSILAKRFQLSSGSLARYLRDSGTTLFAIPIPDAGKGHAFSLQKDVAVQIQIPNRRMLIEHAQDRAVADRKKRWAEYRRTREARLPRYPWEAGTITVTLRLDDCAAVFVHVMVMV